MSVTVAKKSLKKRRRKHGFRARMQTRWGRKILARRVQKEPGIIIAITTAG